MAQGFEQLGVCKELVAACAELKWTSPTPIQSQAIPLALEGKDIIGLAHTGSGKTAAFAIPILQALLKLSSSSAFFGCVICPARELAIQIAEQIQALGSGIGVNCATLVGGIDMVSQAIQLGKGPHIVVGTPGRLADHLSNTKGFSLQKLKYLVLDEADRLLDHEFEESIDLILRQIPRERSTYLFSATMTNKVAKLQRACLRNPAKIAVSTKYCTVDTLKQEILVVPSKQKDLFLVYLLQEMAACTTMVFTRTCDGARRVALLLRTLGMSAIPISGQMSQDKRLEALNKFKAGERKILVCTDVASRGLDIPNVNLVINFDVPSNPKDYVHRVGRTARAGKTGRAILFVCEFDVEQYLRLEAALGGKKLPTYPMDTDEAKTLQERVSEAQRLVTMKMRDDQHTIRNRKRGCSYDGGQRKKKQT